MGSSPEAGSLYSTPPPHSMFTAGEQSLAYQRSHISATGSPSSTTAENDLEDSRNVKRTPKACDRCRHKKTKCTGEYPCQRCRLDNTVCSYTNRRPKEGPNFNPQVAQKDAAMSMLYKCIEDMNHQLLAARLGPYTDSVLASYAESEEFIIGVILDRFGISPVLDDFDNQPVYLPGQHGFNPETCAIEFPNYTGYTGLDDGKIFRSPTAIPKALAPGGWVTDMDIQMTEREIAPLPRLKKARTCPYPVMSTPELERNFGYESSPDVLTPRTPGRQLSDIDFQFDCRELSSGPPSYTYEQQQHQNHHQQGWPGQQKSLDEPGIFYPALSTELSGLESFNNGQFGANPSQGHLTSVPPSSEAASRSGISHSAFQIQAHGQRRISPAPPPRPPPSFPTLNKQQIPLPAHIVQAAELHESLPPPPSRSQWDFNHASSYPSSLWSKSVAVSPEMSARGLGRRTSPARGSSVESSVYGGEDAGQYMSEMAASASASASEGMVGLIRPNNNMRW